ncbi:tripartite tricarboxylate transporter substrate binding protein [Halomonas daqingensis]|uniref:Tripartite tricarboxylate transporter substrate binding protein n=1 Tax=Billgrantia desiderata TaxID=52021 RepID=A0ABS9B9Q3_9GAMM|nr:tripartite tricarboxylate transporter substrate binding protein [Halomonas desiderata]MCE8044390.1 tripartite tricarboxylate transporter substrate binding protein [Halomonas desiderata]MCE8048964.1 tripartite tricarboxylate transporter substrate binding protein [Halomonas desiderata]
MRKIQALLKGSVTGAIGLAMTAAGPMTAMAQEFPDQPITIIVGAAPGGATDLLARLVGREMSEYLGANVVIENVPGAGATIGMTRGATAEPDGYTLSFGNMGHLAANVAIYNDLPFDPIEDFEPIGNVANVPMVLTVSNQSGFETFEAFLAYMEENPGLANFGTSGPGSTGWLAPSLLLSLAGLEAELVTYQGAGPALNDLFAGVMDAQIDQTATMIPVHKEGQAKALAITSEERIEQLPDVPTFAEAGMPEFDMVVWNGLVAPAGTPDDVLVRLEEAVNHALESKALNERYVELAMQVPPPEERGRDAFGALIQSEVERWLSVLTDLD